MVSIIPVTEQVDNIIFANACIDDNFECTNLCIEPAKSNDLPVAVPIELSPYLIAEKLSLSFKMRETCYCCKNCCYNVLYNTPKICCCLAGLASCGYSLYCTGCFGCL